MYVIVIGGRLLHFLQPPKLYETLHLYIPYPYIHSLHKFVHMKATPIIQRTPLTRYMNQLLSPYNYYVFFLIRLLGIPYSSIL